MTDPLAGFARRVEREGLAVDAVVLYRDGKPAGQRRWTPDRPFAIFSHTKSFTAMAVGLAEETGRLRLDHSLADLFPEYQTPGNAGAMESVRLSHLLSMSSGFGRALLMREDRKAGAGGEDYLAYILNQPLAYSPGTAFCYSNGDSYLAGRMAERALGRSLDGFLKERLFDPLEIPPPAWERCPQGHPFGGSGIMMHLQDMVKPGLCCLQGGRWGESRLLPRAWVNAMTSWKIDTGLGQPEGWDSAYGYQCWMHGPVPGAYRFDGAGGQISLMLPGAGALIGLQCHADTLGPLRAAVDEELVLPLLADG